MLAKDGVRLKEVLDFKPAVRLEWADNQSPEQVKDGKHRLG
jgi:hypothetical protein